MRLTYNSLLGTMYRFFKDKIELKEINRMLISCVDSSFERINDTNYDKYASELNTGHADLKKSLCESALTKGSKAISSDVVTYCVDVINAGSTGDLKNILCQLILESTNVEGDDVIIETANITKNTILNDTSDFPVFLGSLIYFIFVNVLKEKHYKTKLDARNGEKAIFSDSDYRALVSQANKFKNPTFDISHLLTVEKKSNFDSVFSEVPNPNNLHSRTPNQFKLYCLDVDSDGFNYNQLREFITKNLNNYIYSRTEIKGFIEKGKIKLIGVEALREIKKHGGMNGDELGHILLYSYLECVLKAPKLFSHFETSRNGIETTGTMHIAYIGGDTPMNQVIVGSADIEDSLLEGIDKALKTANELKGTIEGNFRFVDSAIFDKSLEYVDAQKIKDIIVPHKGKHTYIATGYGIFVGYKVALNPNDYATPEELAEALQNKMLEDINDNFSEIEDKIKEYGLENRSIYLYILPFNDPTNDKDSIITETTSI